MFNRKYGMIALAAMAVFALVAGLLLGGNTAAQTNPPTSTQDSGKQTTANQNGDKNGLKDDKGGPASYYNRPYDATTAADALTRAQTTIQRNQQTLNQAKSKNVDTSRASALMVKANELYNQAKGFNSSSDFYRAGSYADAASLAASAVGLQVAAALNVLPPTSPAGPVPGKDGLPPTDKAVDQRMAVNEMRKAYSQIVEIGNTVKAQSDAGNYAYYVTAAQAIYSDAYGAYKAGAWQKAISLSNAAVMSARVADTLVRSKTAPPAPAVPDPPAPDFNKL